MYSSSSSTSTSSSSSSSSSSSTNSKTVALELSLVLLLGHRLDLGYPLFSRVMCDTALRVRSASDCPCMYVGWFRWNVICSV